MAKLCVVYDKLADKYTAPLIFENDNCGQRWFETKVIDDVNCADYELYGLGDYDDKTAKIVLYEQPKLIFKGLSLEKGNFNNVENKE